MFSYITKKFCYYPCTQWVLIQLFRQNNIILRQLVLDNVERIDNILYGAKQNIRIDERGLGRAIYNKMLEFKDRIMQVGLDFLYLK